MQAAKELNMKKFLKMIRQFIGRYTDPDMKPKYDFSNAKRGPIIKREK
jgi:hypothetical protein